MLNRIKDDMLMARKNKDKVVSNLLITLYSEASMVGKNDGNRETTDIEVLKTIKKFIKNDKETLMGHIELSSEGETTEVMETLKKEISILEMYIPEQLTEIELTGIISTVVAENSICNMKGMGLIMKSLKEKYDGLYDGKLASLIVKKILS